MVNCSKTPDRNIYVRTKSIYCSPAMTLVIANDTLIRYVFDVSSHDKLFPEQIDNKSETKSCLFKYLIRILLVCKTPRTAVPASNSRAVIARVNADRICIRQHINLCVWIVLAISKLSTSPGGPGSIPARCHDSISRWHTADRLVCMCSTRTTRAVTLYNYN